MDWVSNFPPSFCYHVSTFDYGYFLYVYIPQNENVNRPYTSQAKVKDLRRPDRRAAMKVHTKKTFLFVELLWNMYLTCNKSDIT